MSAVCFHTSLDKGDKYSEQQLQDGDGLKKGLRAIIWDCILRQNKLHNPKWDEYIETCVQRSLNEFEEQVLRALTNARHDVSNKLLDDIVAIALGAVDLAEQHARSKHEMIHMHWKRGWASASARVGTLSRGWGVLEDTLHPPLTSPQSWGIWTYPQARPEVYHICISNIMKRKKGLISSIFKEQKQLFDAYITNFLQAKFPLSDIESWFDSEALIREYAIREGAQQAEQSRASAGNMFLFKHGECEKSFAAALAKFNTDKAF